jgi:cytochrome oxidase assembly protein ShyY1
MRSGLGGAVCGLAGYRRGVAEGSEVSERVGSRETSAAAPAPAAVDSSAALAGWVRVFLTPRWLVLSVVALSTIVGFGLLSHWQWERAHRGDLESAAAADPAAVSLATLLPDSTPLAAAVYGRQATVTGSYDRAAQRLVRQSNGYWVVSPLRTVAGDIVAVVRGVVPTATTVPPTPSGIVTVTGRIQPYDGDPGVQPGDAGTPAGQLPRLTPSALDPLVDQPVVGGFLTLAEQQPASSLPLVPPAYTSQPTAGLRWQNASYAVQWVLFAGFVVFMWQRWFRDEVAEARDKAATATLPIAAT